MVFVLVLISDKMCITISVNIDAVGEYRHCVYILQMCVCIFLLHFFVIVCYVMRSSRIYTAVISYLRLCTVGYC